MRKRNIYTLPDAMAVTTDIHGLAASLSCGLSTARAVGKAAEARVYVGRRVLYDMDSVK